MERRDFIIKKTNKHHTISWKRLGGFGFLTVNTLIEAIAVQFLSDGDDFVHINFCGLYGVPENDNKQNLVVDKFYYALFEIEGKYMLLNVSEANAPLIEVEICWIGSTCNGQCGNEVDCKFIKMLSKVSSGKLYFKNKLVD